MPPRPTAAFGRSHLRTSMPPSLRPARCSRTGTPAAASPRSSSSPRPACRNRRPSWPRCCTTPIPALSAAVLGHFGTFRYSTTDRAGLPADLFEQLEKVIPKIPEAGKPLQAPVEGWHVADLKRSSAADLLFQFIEDRPGQRLLPHLSVMTQHHRVAALAKVCEPRTLSNRVRQTLMAIAGEPLHAVRAAALTHLKKCKLAEDEVRTLEGYLTRKVADFRRGVFELLLNRPDKLVLGTIDRLLAASEANQRAAGIELARRMIEADRQAAAVRTRLEAFRDQRGKKLAAADAKAIAIILDPSLKPPTLYDGLGTFDPADRSAVVPPEHREVEFATPAAVAFLKQLDELIHQNREATFTVTHPSGVKDEFVLGSISYASQFTGPSTGKKARRMRKCCRSRSFGTIG